MSLPLSPHTWLQLLLQWLSKIIESFTLESEGKLNPNSDLTHSGQSGGSYNLFVYLNSYKSVFWHTALIIW